MSFPPGPWTTSGDPSADGSNTADVKTYNHLFTKIISFENLLIAAGKAQKGKRFKPTTALFNLNLEKELLSLQNELIEKGYRHGNYRDFQINDPKKRLISAAPYRDRVVHHALCNIIEPIFDRKFIYDSYACRINKGTHAAMERYTAFARKNRYVLKCDIKKYFQSIDQKILLEILNRTITCGDTRWLMRRIVTSRIDDSHAVYFKGDDLFTPYQRHRGIPIGNLTSQFFANVYLNGFDHFAKEDLGCKYYIRYVDDFVVFDQSKTRLHEVRTQFENYLTKLRLKLHEKKCRIFKVDEGVCFLGFRIFPTHRLLKKQNLLYMRRKLKRMQTEYQEEDLSIENLSQRIQSWVSHAEHGDTYRIRSRIFSDVVFKRGSAAGAAGR
jgi:retron-type reverse transcriptase